MNNICKQLALELSIKEEQVKATIKLIDEGNTIPFIARYRKEVTGNLSDEILRKFSVRLEYLRNLEKRKEEVIRLIDQTGNLTDEIKNKIENANILTEVEDIYRPYKPKKKTKAMIAKQKGVEPLANIILKQTLKSGDKLEVASKYLNPKEEVNTPEDAIKYAMDIIVEKIAENDIFRKQIRRISYRTGKICTVASDKENKTVYDMYYNFSEDISKIASHRILAIFRGEREGALKVKFQVDEEQILKYLTDKVILSSTIFDDELKKCIEEAYKKYIKPSIEREIMSDKFEEASNHAIEVFGVNVKNLLMQAPIKNIVVMGFDPAYRTGCKIAIIDQMGKFLDYTVVYPTEPQNDIAGATKELTRLIDKYNVNMIAIGNGTASRESEKFVADLIKKQKHKVYYTIVSEAGASVYSASELATKEYPNVTVSIRGAISIARRLQDPLAELVKIDPKSIGVGQYQHDVNQKVLASTLTGVVEDAVNTVGVDANTATPSLLSYVSGINNTVATNIVKYREENGKFLNRKDLLKVDKLGKTAFVQCAGFIKVPESNNFLDNTMVHPESYDVALKLIDSLGIDKKDIKEDELRRKLENVNVNSLATKLNVGEPTLLDIINELKKPGRDVREDMPHVIVKSDVVKIEDIKVGDVLDGTVRNVTDFGAFVDIGIKNDGLVHISELSDKFVKNPMDEVSVGDIVKVKVIKVDLEKNKVSLSMKGLK